MSVKLNIEEKDEPHPGSPKRATSKENVLLRVNYFNFYPPTYYNSNKTLFLKVISNCNRIQLLGHSLNFVFYSSNKNIKFSESRSK